MISQLNSSAIRSAYSNTLGDSKGVQKSSTSTISSQGDMSRVEQLKESLESGDYKVNLQLLSEKIADTLL